ncbi:MAG: phosphoenolpyruvate mutase [Nocardioides sp.]
MSGSMPPGLLANSTATAGATLRQLLDNPELCQLMGAHDGMSARIAATAGFPALWASGLCISTALGLRDCDEATWTELLAVVATMVETTCVPILVDGDTGYGNFNTARRFAQHAERIGAAGVCFEDKVFPKMNSFVGNGHALAPIAEYCGKIQACKEAQHDDGFVVVARTEAMIAGLGVEEAVRRAHHYVDAGADAVFVHSRQSAPGEIIAFMDRWDTRVPVLIAPTTFHRVPVPEFRRLGIGAVIWANHPMRVAFDAMSRLCDQVLADDGIHGVEGALAGLHDVFSLYEYDQLAEDERRYAAPHSVSSP